MIIPSDGVLKDFGRFIKLLSVFMNTSGAWNQSRDTDYQSAFLSREKSQWEFFTKWNRNNIQQNKLKSLRPMAAFKNFPVERTVLFYVPLKRLRISSRNMGTDGLKARPVVLYWIKLIYNLCILDAFKILSYISLFFNNDPRNLSLVCTLQAIAYAVIIYCLFLSQKQQLSACIPSHI